MQVFTNNMFDICLLNLLHGCPDLVVTGSSYLPWWGPITVPDQSASL